jgi:hypothetical protein
MNAVSPQAISIAKRGPISISQTVSIMLVLGAFKNFILENTSNESFLRSLHDTRIISNFATGSKLWREYLGQIQQRLDA